MKRFGARYLTAAALGCLLILWALPASAYYPPLQATANWGWPWNWVYRSVKDPKLNKLQELTSQWGGPDVEIVDLKQHNGVISWIFRNGATYFVYYSVYDPDLAKFKEDIQGPFNGVTRFTVNDGVVAYVADIPPSGTNPGYLDVRYATYNPSYANWMHNSHPNPNYSAAVFKDLIVKDGIVVDLWDFYGGVGMANMFEATAYDAKANYWNNIAVLPNIGAPSNYITSFTITNATITYYRLIPYGVANVLGFDHNPYGFYWYDGPTKPMAYFVAQPKIGTKPMWVWFTDMSIGATTWNWNFDDNKPPSTNPSPYHTFDSSGTFWVSQQVSGPNGSNTYTDPIIVAYPIVLKKRIPGVLYLLLLAD